MALLDLLQSHLTPDAVSAIGKQIGADEGQTQSAIGAALPVLVGALANNAQKPGGADALASALGKHDGSVLGNLASAVLSQGHANDGAGILGHVLGGRQDTVAQGIGQATGLSGDQSAQLLKLLAPAVLGALGKQASQGGLDAGGLASMLGQEKSNAQAAQPSLLVSLLDRDGDGSIVGEAAQLGVGLLGQLFKK